MGHTTLTLPHSRLQNLFSFYHQYVFTHLCTHELSVEFHSKDTENSTNYSYCISKNLGHNHVVLRLHIYFQVVVNSCAIISINRVIRYSEWMKACPFPRAKMDLGASSMVGARD